MRGSTLDLELPEAARALSHHAWLESWSWSIIGSSADADVLLLFVVSMLRFHIPGCAGGNSPHTNLSVHLPFKRDLIIV